MQPDPNTAIILDNIVTQLNNIKRIEDVSLAVCEFAMGFATSARTWDLSFGLSSIETNKEANLDYDVVLGKGVVTYISSEIIMNGTNGEYPLNIQALLTDIAPLQNTYAFGSIYLKYNSGAEIDVSLYPYGTHPLLMFRDIDQNTVMDMIMDDKIGSAAPSGTLELFRFIVDIEDYTHGVGSVLNKLRIILIDKRKIRGWAGFAEENMAVNLIPTLLERKDNIYTSIDTSSGGNSLEDVIKNLVATWMDMDWEGGFNAFWYDSINNPTSLYILPDALKTYIDANF
jgi:hypothetical protein